MHSHNRIDEWICRGLLPALAGLAVGSCDSAPPGRFRTPDGFTIACSLYRPDGDGAAPLVVAGHQLGRDRHSWAPLVPRLTSLGFAVLTLDHRGFGESTAEAASPADLSEIDLATYRRLDVRWRNWQAVADACRVVAVRMLDRIAKAGP